MSILIYEGFKLNALTFQNKKYKSFNLNVTENNIILDYRLKNFNSNVDELENLPNLANHYRNIWFDKKTFDFKPANLFFQMYGNIISLDHSNIEKIFNKEIERLEIYEVFK